MLFTLADLVEHLVQYSGNDPSARNVINAKSAAQTAIKVLGAYDWNCLKSSCIVNTNTPYQTGRVEIDAATRQATLTGGTWPTWAEYGYLIVQSVVYQVGARNSGSVITLSQNNGPLTDIPADTPYIMRQDRYLLPENFGSATSAIAQPGLFPLRYMNQATIYTGRNYQVGTGRPQYFNVANDPNAIQRKMMTIWPSPNTNYAIQLTYKKNIDTPLIRMQTEGTATCTAASTTVTGYNTNWDSKLINSVIRLSKDGNNYPTGQYGDNAAYEELLVTGVNSPTELVVLNAPSDTLTNVKYVLTSYLDLDPQVLSEFLFRECERQYRILCRIPHTAEEMRARDEAYVRARETDNAYTGAKAMSTGYRAGPFDFVTLVPYN